MEALLQSLQEQQIQLQLEQQQHLFIDDLANMESLNDGKPPLPPPRKYVSIFRIDGEPILPPLVSSLVCIFMFLELIHVRRFEH